MSTVTEIEELMKLGKQLGYEDNDLRTFVKEQQEVQRAERALRREQEKEEKEERVAREQREYEAREKESQRRHEREMKELEVSRNGAREPDSVVAKAPRLPSFEENKDQIDAYIERFERFATNNKWPEATWAGHLSALLSGKALDVYYRLSPEESRDFNILKQAVLSRYDLNAEGFRKKFRESVAEDIESPAQFMTRLGNYVMKWLESMEVEKRFDALFEVMVMEQFVSVCNTELATFLKERTCKDVKTLAATTTKYLEAHGKQLKDCCKRTGGGKQQQTGDNRTCLRCGRIGHIMKDCRVNAEEMKPAAVQCGYCKRTGHDMAHCIKLKLKSLATGSVGAAVEDTRTCYLCQTVGHIARFCPKNKGLVNAGGAQEGDVQSAGVATIVESSCDEEVSTDGVLSGERNACDCLKGNVARLACGKEVELVSVGCGSTNQLGLQVWRGVLNGRDVSVLRDTGCNGIVVKKEFVDDHQFTGRYKYIARIDKTLLKAPVAKVSISTPFLTGEFEALCLNDALCDLTIGNVEGARRPDNPDLTWVGAMETRAQARRGKVVNPLKVPSRPEEDITADKLVEMQRADDSLRKLYDCPEVKEKGNGKSWYEVVDKVLYRMYQNPWVNQGKPVKQVVVPKELRSQVLGLAHDSIMGGHLGVKKTTDKVMSNFYWPGVNTDVALYCKSCDACQRTIHRGKVGKVPLEKLPIIDVPFRRVSYDLVGPIYPASERGHRYILTAVDHASRYPEAVPLKNIDTVSVAEAMVDMYSRVGIPDEVLSDLGTQFISEVMSEVNRLLSIRQMTTTPYHPICNGLVEKWNGTLKQMLKKLCCEKPKDWDRYINALLFAYREVPQESTGFSPFELLYGRTVKGPMQILRKLWTENAEESQVKISYQYVVDLKERLEETLEIAHKNLGKAQSRYKHHYDRKARPRSLKVGEKVLVLLPTDKNKLLMQWRGPFTVEGMTGKNDYKVKVKGKIRTYHINLLKQYVQRDNNAGGEARPVVEVAGIAVIEYEGEESDRDMDDEELLELPKLPVQQTEVVHDIRISKHLSPEQRHEVSRLLEEFSDVFTDVPGVTNLVEHKIEMVTDEPIRRKPYPIPYSMRESLKEDVDKMLKLGVIRPSDSPYCAPPVIVRKKDGTNRVTVDYRLCNKQTLFDCEPVEKPQDIFARVCKDKVYSKFDMTKGYWQIPMREEDIKKTAFVTPDGCYEFLRMPFGLMNSGATYTRMMRKLTAGLQNIDHYIDDCLIHTSSWEEHLTSLRSFLVRVREAGLTLRPSKCEIGFDSVDFVGHKIGKGEIRLHVENVKKIVEAPRPETKKQVRSFLGLTGFYREYIPSYATIALPLTELTKKGLPNQVEWGVSQENAYQTLKHLLTADPVLRLPDLNEPFTLRTDASGVGVGAVLLQEHDGKLHPVAYASKKLLPREQRYSTMEKECLAIVWAVRKFMVYLYGRQFVLQTDHQPLAYLSRAKYINDRIMRWALFLQPYRMSVQAIKGSTNVGADYLSRVVV